jgi:hypothetical protein
LLIVVPKGAPSDNADSEPAADVLPPPLRGFNGDSVDCACVLFELFELPLSLRALVPARRRLPADEPAAFGLLLAEGPEKWKPDMV